MILIASSTIVYFGFFKYLYGHFCSKTQGVSTPVIIIPDKRSYIRRDFQDMRAFWPAI
jgi:hypothetical protein